MKKTALLLSSLCMLFSTISCDTRSSEEIKMEYKIEGETFKLSTIVDETLDSGVRSYSVIAPYTDTYNFSLGIPKYFSLVNNSNENSIASSLK